MLSMNLNDVCSQVSVHCIVFLVPLAWLLLQKKENDGGVDTHTHTQLIGN